MATVVQERLAGAGGAARVRSWRPPSLRSSSPRPLLLAALAALAALLLSLGWAVPAAAQAGQASGQGYVLGPNDALTVIVYGQNEFNVSTRVKPDGSIVMPLIGRVQASGKNVIQLAEEVRSRLVSGNFLRDPIVNVEITEYNSRFARMVGQLGSPGLLPLDREYRVLDALLRAGWVRDSGANYVILRRGSGGREIRLSTDELARGGEGSNLIVEPGDTLFVDKAELVFVTGQVARPGAYPLEPGMTVQRLLALAGGVTATGSSGRFGLKRGPGREQTVDESFEVQKDDVVHVRERLF